MFWIRKNPFASHEDPVQHIVALLSLEAENAGTPFNDHETKILSSEAERGEPVPEELQEKAKKLIEQLLKKEQSCEAGSDPKSFGNSLEWAGDPAYPNIVALAEDVITSGGSLKPSPRLHGRRWVKDRAQLIGCGFALFFLMLLIVVVVSLVFHVK